MEIITIVLEPTMIAVYDGRVKGSKLYATAGNLQIWKKGTVTKPRKDDLNWHMMNQCIVRHIPVASLRRADCGCGGKKKNHVSFEQLDLFGGKDGD